MNVGDKVKAQIGDGPSLAGEILEVKNQDKRNENPVIYLVKHQDEAVPNRYYTPKQLTKVSGSN